MSAGAVEAASKACTRCGEVKSVDDFYAHRGGQDGRETQCRDCRNAVHRARRATPEGQATRRARQTSQVGRECTRQVASTRHAAFMATRCSCVERRSWTTIAAEVRRMEPACAFCGAATKRADHSKALSRGGATCFGNLRGLCERCDKRKGADRTPAELAAILEAEGVALRYGWRFPGLLACTAGAASSGPARQATMVRAA